MVILIRTAYPRKVDYERISDVRQRLKKENATSKEKIEEIFSEIGVEFDLNEV
ncbi:hypothetical protein [Methanobrevibacter sp.]|uniref:hypothetical protein n=1 Tax=Methanobrevibacter sp. TaxID=66852 RepID=UPI00386B9C16